MFAYSDIITCSLERAYQELRRARKEKDTLKIELAEQSVNDLLDRMKGQDSVSHV